MPAEGLRGIALDGVIPEIKHVDVKPTSVIVLKFSQEPPSKGDVDYFKHLFAVTFPNNRTIMIGPGVELQVVDVVA